MKPVARRDFLKLTGSSLIGLTLGGVALRASAQEKVSPEDPTAKALQYVNKSAVDGAYCEGCMYIQGEAGQEWRPCAIFPGKTVAAKGWCSAYLKKG
jgi:hypothetical protein